MERSTPIRQTNAQRVKRSTPTGRLVPNGRSDQPRPSGGCPAEEAISSNRQTGVQREKGLSLQPPDWTEDEGLDQLRRLCPRCLLRRARSNPLRQHSLVGNRGRANHPPVGPVQQGSRTQVSMVGNLGQKPNSAVIITPTRPAREGLQDPPGKLPPNRSLKLPAKPPHARPGYRHNRPKVRRRRSSRLRRALRVS